VHAIYSRGLDTVGDWVQLRELPEWAHGLTEQGLEVIRSCVGKAFQVSAILDDGLVQLDVSVVVVPLCGKSGDGSFIRVESCYLNAADSMPE
jgi:hypothetical protein